MSTITPMNTPAPALLSKEAKFGFLARQGFRFKQFTVLHDHSSMKVGTDGVLIGAWAPISNKQSAISNQPYCVLDIGTGSGLIALMLAQRCPEAQVDAIDIDEASCLQARENFDASPWAERLHVTNCSLQNWLSREYDLIVSNPPYFVDSLKAPNAARSAARHNDTLPFSTLIREAVRLLKSQGIIALIVPAEVEDELQTLAASEGLQCTHRCYVHPKPGRPPKRVMLAWQHKKATNTGYATNHLTLEDDHAARSAEYKELTRDFYL